jgi:hypothetical protein
MVIEAQAAETSALPARIAAATNRIQTVCLMVSSSWRCVLRGILCRRTQISGDESSRVEPMTIRKAEHKNESQVTEMTTDLIEEKLVAFAEQLGVLVGAVQARAEGWLDRTALAEQISRIRDGAADLLAQVNRKDSSEQNAAANATATSAARPSRGPVDAPGKRHRKPAPQVKLKRPTPQPRGKHMGQKAFKTGRAGRGRG